MAGRFCWCRAARCTRHGWPRQHPLQPRPLLAPVLLLRRAWASRTAPRTEPGAARHATQATQPVWLLLCPHTVCDTLCCCCLTLRGRTRIRTSDATIVLNPSEHRKCIYVILSVIVNFNKPYCYQGAATFDLSVEIYLKSDPCSVKCGTHQ